MKELVNYQTYLEGYRVETLEKQLREERFLKECALNETQAVKSSVLIGYGFIALFSFLMGFCFRSVLL